MDEFNQQNQNVEDQVNIDEMHGDIGQVGDQVSGDKISVGDSEDSIIAAGDHAQVTVNFPKVDEEPAAPGWWKELLKNRTFGNVRFVFLIIISIIGGFFAIIAFGASLPGALQTARESGLLPPRCVFSRAAEGEVLILVFAIDVAENVPSSAAHSKIRKEIEDKRKELGLGNVRAEIEPNVILKLSESEKAQKIGESCAAAVVIWGEESSPDLSVNFLNIKEPQASASDEQVLVLAPDSDANAEFVARRLPEHLAFLALFAIGQAIVAEGDYAQAIPIMEATVASISEELVLSDKDLASPDSASAAYFWLGWLYLRKSDSETALINIEEAIRLKPDYVRAIYARGYIALEQDNAATAISDFSYVIDSDDDYVVDAYYGRGQAYHGTDEFKLALQDYTQAIDLDPERADIPLARADTYIELGDYDAAEKDYRLILRNHPNDANANNNLAWFYAETLDRNFDEAVTLALRAVEQGEDPDRDFDNAKRASFLDTLGWAYYKQGELQKAKDYLNKAHSLSPDNSRITNRRNEVLAAEMEESND